jgi:hypothetical protein
VADSKGGYISQLIRYYQSPSSQYQLPIYTVDVEDGHIGLGVLLRDTWKQYVFWRDLNTHLLVMNLAH